MAGAEIIVCQNIWVSQVYNCEEKSPLDAGFEDFLLLDETLIYGWAGGIEPRFRNAIPVLDASLKVSGYIYVNTPINTPSVIE